MIRFYFIFIFSARKYREILKLRISINSYPSSNSLSRSLWDDYNCIYVVLRCKEPGVALEAYGARELTKERTRFLLQFVKAQVVMYEDGPSTPAAPPLRGWFFWNFKMEQNVYEEWDFLYGLEKGWMPRFKRGVSATQMFGSCQQIYDETIDDEVIYY
jgi:hypothetical protein